MENISSKFNSINSRYNNTPLYEKDIDSKDPKKGQVIFYGIAVLPEILESLVGDFIVLKRENIGRFDLLANQYYGTCELWWVIALANDIQDMFDEDLVGRNIRIPAMSSISSILGLVQ